MVGCCHDAHDIADFRSGFVWFGSSPYSAEIKINFFGNVLVLLGNVLVGQGLLGQGLLRQGLLRQGLLVLTLGFRTFWFCRERSGCAGLVS